MYLLEEKYYGLVDLPEALYGCVEGIYDENDRRFFDAADSEGNIPEGVFTEEELSSGYSKAVLNKKGKDRSAGYCIADFYSRMDVVVEKEMDLFDRMSPENEERIRFHMMDPDYWLPILAEMSEKSGVKPQVMPLEVIREHFRNAEGHFFALKCNCNAYIGGCDRDKSKVCLHSMPGDPPINTMADRGVISEISKEELIEHLEEADRMGLVHKGRARDGKVDTCDCCTCCCIHLSNYKDYDLKGRRVTTDYVIRVDAGKCVNCGMCIEMCQFGALESNGEYMTADAEKCWGCGVCRNNCAAGALVIEKR